MFHSTRKSRRHRNPRSNEEQQKPFFSKAKDGNEPTVAGKPFFQAKLAVGKPGDQYEKEADAVADKVVSGNGQAPVLQRQPISAVQKTNLATPVEDEKLGTAEARMEKDKLIQEKPELQAQEEEEEVQMQPEEEEEEALQMQEEEEEVQMQPEEEEEEEEAVQMQEEEEEEVQMQEEEEEPVQMQEEEEEVQMQEEEELQMQEEEEEELQAKSDPSALARASSNISQRLQSSAGHGKPMPGKTRAEMEQAFGISFGGVNIHTGSDAVKMNKELGAQAFTHGKDVYFNTGKFNPERSDGKRLLAHELTHVVQQKGGQLKKSIQKKSDVVTEESDPIGSMKHKKKDASAEVPGLTKEVYEKVQKLINEKKRAEALDVLVEFLKKDGQIDGTLLKGGKMYYGGKGEGLASPPGYKKDPVTGEKKAKPTPIKVGRAAFKNVAWLYSSIMHEYIHVLQFQEPVARGTKGQRGLGWLIKRQEVEAYSYEIMNAEKTGLDKHPDLIKENWTRLNSYWKGLGRSSKKLLSTMYENAYQKAKSIVKGKKLIYRPYKGK